MGRPAKPQGVPPYPSRTGEQIIENLLWSLPSLGGGGKRGSLHDGWRNAPGVVAFLSTGYN